MASKTAAGLVAWCKENLGMPYWYCSQGQRPTLEWLQQKIRQYPNMWTPARIAKAKTEAGRFPRCFDCVGLIKGYLWVQPSGGLKYNAAQDKSADGMRAVSNPQPMSALPETPGVLVFMPGHVGVYIGGGRVIECYGFMNVANRPLSAQRWTFWGRCPFIQLL
jgi:cell wall-associated NlpC family hydrolase